MTDPMVKVLLESNLPLKYTDWKQLAGMLNFPIKPHLARSKYYLHDHAYLILSNDLINKYFILF